MSQKAVNSLCKVQSSITKTRSGGQILNFDYRMPLGNLYRLHWSIMSTYFLSSCAGVLLSGILWILQYNCQQPGQQDSTNLEKWSCTLERCWGLLANRICQSSTCALLLQVHQAFAGLPESPNLLKGLQTRMNSKSTKVLRFGRIWQIR